MANEPVEKPGSLLQSVARMIEDAVNEGAGYDQLIPVLSLICLVSILGHGQPRAAVSAAPAVNASPLQKLLGDLAKGDGGGLGPDTLVSLLPLLNSPQIKSKLNPTTIGAIMGMLGNMGGMGGTGEKSDKGEAAKQEKGGDKGEKSEDKPSVPPTAATVTSLAALAEKQENPEPADGEKRGLGKYLNWKTNF